MDIRQLIAESAMRGFVPNPWLWNAMVERGGLQAVPDAPDLPPQYPSRIIPGGPSTFDTLRQLGGGTLPLARQAFTGLSLGTPGLDGLMEQAGSLLGGVGGLYGLGSSIASGNTQGIIGGALSTGALASRLAGNAGLLGGAGGAGSLVSSLSPYLGAIGSLYGLGSGIAKGNIPGAIIGAVPGALTGAGGILSGLGAAQAATIPVAAEGGFGGAAGAALGEAGAGLSGVGGFAGLYAAAILMAMQDQAQQDPESRREETQGIQRNFPGAWSSLEATPGTLENVARYDRVPGGGGVDLASTIKQAQDALYRQNDISHYVATRGGASKESPDADVSAFEKENPRLYADAMLSLLKGTQDWARAGKDPIPNTNVWGGPFYNQFPEGSLSPDNAPKFNPAQALWALASQAGLDQRPRTGISGDPEGRGLGDQRYQGDMFYPSLQRETDYPFTPSPVGPVFNWSTPSQMFEAQEQSSAPQTTPHQEYTHIEQFSPEIEKQLAGVTPANEYDTLIGILKQANPNFNSSVLGTEVGNLNSTQFSGRARIGEGMGGGTGLPFAPSLPSAGQQSADKQQLSTEAGALATPINTNSGNTLDQALAAGRAFIGSA